MGTKALSGMWPDPRTGIYYLRKRIPARLRPVAAVRGRRISGSIIKLTTGTADRKEAAKRWPGVLASYAALEADWERQINVVHLTPEGACHIAALWIAKIGRTVRPIGTDTEIVLRHLSLDENPPDDAAVVQAEARAAAELAGVAVSSESWPILVHVMSEPVRAAYRDAEARYMRDTAHPASAGRSLDRLAAALPHPGGQSDSPADSTPGKPEVSLRSLYQSWADKTVVKARTVEETRYIVELLATQLGHDDAARIDAPGLRAWRDAMLAHGRTNNTWNNRLSMLNAVLAWGVSEGHLPANPAEGLRLRKNRQQSPLPYSDADAAKILNAARAETRPSLRWAHWLMAFSGMRAGEVLQLTAQDVRQDGDLWFIAVHEDDATKSVKTGQRRNVPIHPALIAEGFTAYARSIPGDEPLFPDKALDKHGNRGGRAWNVIGKWVRRTVGITDPLKAPDHSWRHRVEDELRAAEVPEDARDAIVGHSRQTTGRQYGIRGESMKRLHTYLARLPVPAGVTVPAAETR